MKSAALLLSLLVMVVGVTGCTSGPELTPILLQGRIIPDGVGIEPLSGHVVVSDGCLAIALDSGPTYPVVWPAGAALESGESTLIAFPNGKIAVGDRLDPSAGFLIPASSVSKSVVDIDSCVEAPDEIVAVLTSINGIVFGQ
ncbi:hypothetical protein [Homoserinimonas sp. OAct 916]|uniref:hypothetical protein n=1 Tax=Homoserinimonas sp. OAct 916 TaxID=2211450 RepID=UPI000DBE597E|nr:hypothetical protein [Homoserinimonas sp. OAct 916]